MREVLWSLIICWLAAGAASSLPASDVRSNAILWLERNQNADGSWGSDPTRPVATAEALLALAVSGRSNGPVAQRAIGWLASQELENHDYRARALRALTAAGVDVSPEASALNGEAPYSPGWGPSSSEDVTSYDTALVLAALAAAGVTIGDQTVRAQAVLDRRRFDDGWSGDGVDDAAASDLTTSGEIVRALAPLGLATELAPTIAFLEAEAVGPASDSLELAARLAAIHSTGATNTAISTELYADLRLVAGVWSETDPLINAVGLIAVSSTPSPDPPFVDPPFDADADQDGKRDAVDEDRDGDGYCNPGDTGDCVGTDLFPDDPTEHADVDGDGVGDSADADDDGDDLDDVMEAELGTDPGLADTDGDGQPDGVDACPLIAYADLGGGQLEGVDQDLDGICTPMDECDAQQDPLDIHDLNGDGECNGLDPDDDGDGWSDIEELAWGSDPLDATSFPDDIASTDPGGDFDHDGLSNGEEGATYLTNPFLADSDADGAPDLYEIGAGTDPLLASDQPPAAIGVLSVTGASPGLGPEVSGPGASATVTGGQPTPVSSVLADMPSEGPGVSLLAGFQPQVYARDIDGDGLTWSQEHAQRTSGRNPDTDGDGFADGPGGLVPVARIPDAWDLDGETGDGFADGEADYGTDPASDSDHPGKPADVAPLGHPDGQLNLADEMVGLRLAEDPGILDSLPAANADIARSAADMNQDEAIDVGDALQILETVESAE